MYCDKCGRKLDDGMKFCDWCGTKLSNPVQAKPKQSEYKKGLIAVTTLIVSVLVIALVSGGINSLIKNNYVSKQDCLIQGTYHIKDVDADGNITSYSYWNPYKSNSLLVFTSTGDKIGSGNGYTLLKKEESNRFSWNVDGNKLSIYSPYTNKTIIYTFSETSEPDTWYYDKNEKALRIGVTAYSSIDESDVTSQYVIKGIPIKDENGYLRELK